MAGGVVATPENVTVLFTDLVGSTELASALNQADADDLRSAHFSGLRRAAAASGGSEVKNLGDGLMVVFPTASAALAGAVAMQQGVERYNRRTGRSLGLRVGLSCGEATRDGVDYFGDPVVEAARLCALAEGGQILATAAIRVMAGRRSPQKFSALGPFELKGLPEPVETLDVGWEPLAESFDEARIPLPSRLEVGPAIGVIGRERESSWLADAFRRVSSPEGREVVLMSGEPGIGKTALAAHLARRGFEAGACVLLGRCDEDLSVPYEAFVEALHHYLSFCPDEILQAHVQDHGAALAAIVPTLRTRCGQLPPLESTDPDAERYRLYGAVGGLLAEVSVAQPVVLILDDLQWADSPTLALLRHLAASPMQMRLLIVGTYRPAELAATHPLTEALVALRREPGVSTLELGGLDNTGVIAFLEAAAGHSLDATGLGLADAIYRETDGNPFFVGEVLRHLSETGAIDQDDAGRWRTSTGLDLETLPDSVRQAISLRVTRLGTFAHRVLPMASVFGREFDLELLAAVTGSAEDDLLEVLEATRAAALVDEVSDVPGRFSFAHALIQHALYQEPGATRRAAAHRSVAKALEATRTSLSASQVFEIAHHWLLGARPTDLDSVVKACRDAAQRAVELLSFDDAVRWYAEALTRGSTLSPVERRKLLVPMGAAQIQAHALVKGRATLRDAALSIDDKEEPSALAELALTYHGPSRVAHRDPAERPLLERAIAAVGVGGRPEVRARLLAQLSLQCYDDVDPDKLTLAREALGLAEASGDPQAICDAQRAMFFPHFGRPGHAPAPLEVAEAIVASSTQINNLQAMIEGHWARFLARVALGERAKASQDLATLADLSERSGLRAEQALVRFIEARELINAGRFEEAEQTSTAALEIGREDESSLASYGAQLIAIRRWQGRIDEALGLLDLAGANPAPEVENLLRVMRGVLLFESTDAELRRAQIREIALDAFNALTGVGSWTRPIELAALAELAFGQRDRELGESVRDLLSDWDGLFLQVTLIDDWGPCSFYLALLDRLLDRNEQAVHRLEHALRDCDEQGLITWAALVRSVLSGSLEDSGAAIDRRRSQLLAAEAEATALKLGLRRVERSLSSV
jgi:class 3 adenylate cyclase/tetratricopeptide (TPR) repeat protein